MGQVYKGHGIQVLAWPDRSGWKPSLFVIYSEGAQHILKNFTIDRIFSTCEKAEQAGLACAQKWIDDGKPDPGYDPQKIEQRMDALAREFAKTRDSEIPVAR